MKIVKIVTYSMPVCTTVRRNIFKGAFSRIEELCGQIVSSNLNNEEVKSTSQGPTPDKVSTLFSKK